MTNIVSETRAKMGVSQTAFAAMLGISHRQLKYFEGGHKVIPKWMELACIALVPETGNAHRIWVTMATASNERHGPREAVVEATNRLYDATGKVCWSASTTGSAPEKLYGAVQLALWDAARRDGIGLNQLNLAALTSMKETPDA